MESYNLWVRLSQQIFWTNKPSLHTGQWLISCDIIDAVIKIYTHLDPSGNLPSTLKSPEANGEKIEFKLSQGEIIKNLNVKEGTEPDEEQPQQEREQHPITA